MTSSLVSSQRVRGLVDEEDFDTLQELLSAQVVDPIKVWEAVERLGTHPTAAKQWAVWLLTQGVNTCELVHLVGGVL